jgi:hypothetical protein
MARMRERRPQSVPIGDIDEKEGESEGDCSEYVGEEGWVIEMKGGCNWVIPNEC